MLEVHQHYTLDTPAGTYLLLCTKYRPEYEDLFLRGEGWTLWVAEDGRLWPYVGKSVYYVPTPYTVADLVPAPDVECINVSPNDPGFWLDPDCKAPNMLNVTMPVELEDELRGLLQ